MLADLAGADVNELAGEDGLGGGWGLGSEREGGGEGEQECGGSADHLDLKVALQGVGRVATVCDCHTV